jgi:DNA-binding HxlR family transcriptional regulator
MSRSYQQICPIAQTLDIIGERWTLLILRDLLVFDKTKFSELRDSLPGIPVRMLSERLQKLEEHGLVERRVYSEHPLRASYHPTAKAWALKPALGELALWGMEHVLSAKERRIVGRHVDLSEFARP